MRRQMKLTALIFCFISICLIYSCSPQYESKTETDYKVRIPNTNVFFVNLANTNTGQVELFFVENGKKNGLSVIFDNKQRVLYKRIYVNDSIKVEKRYYRDKIGNVDSVHLYKVTYEHDKLIFYSQFKYINPSSSFYSLKFPIFFSQETITYTIKTDGVENFGIFLKKINTEKDDLDSVWAKSSIFRFRNNQGYITLENVIKDKGVHVHQQTAYFEKKIDNDNMVKIIDIYIPLIKIEANSIFYQKVLTNNNNQFFF